MAKSVPDSIPGDLWTLQQLVTSLQTVAGNARDARSRLQSYAGELQWTGAAADAFRNQVGDVPDALAKVDASFTSAMNVLQSYINTIDQKQQPYRQLVGRYWAAVEEHEHAEHNRQHAQDTGQDDTYFRQQAESLLGTIDDLYRQVRNLYNDAAGTAAWLRNQLDGAADAGIRNDFWNTAGRYGGDVVGFAGGVLEGIKDAAVKLVQSLGKLAEDVAAAFAAAARGDWAAMGQHLAAAVQDLHDVASALNSLLSALAPLLQFIPVVGEIVDTVLLVTAIVMVVTDLVTTGIKFGEGVAHGGLQEGLTAASEELGDLEDDTLDLATSAGSKFAGGLAAGKAAGAAKGKLSTVTGSLKRATRPGTIAHLKDERGWLKQVVALPEHASFRDLKALRAAGRELGVRPEYLRIANPTLVNAFGIRVSYHAISTGLHVADFGDHAYRYHQKPEPTQALEATESGVDLVKSIEGE